MPSALREGGFFASLVLILLMGALVNWSMIVLVRNGIATNILDYRVLVESVAGKWGSVLYFLSGFIFAYGICAAYSVVAADTIVPLIHAVITDIPYESLRTEGSTWVKVFTDRRVISGFISLFIFLPISIPKYLKNLSVSSFLGLVMFVWVAISSLAVAWVNRDDQGIDPGIFTIIKVAGIPSVISRAAFACVCHHNQFIIYRSLKKQTLSTYTFVACVSVGFAVILGALFGALGYIPLANIITNGNILNFLPSRNIWVQLAQFAFALDVIFTYPLELFVSRELIVEAIHGGDSQEIRRSTRIIYTTLLVFGIWIITVFVCDLNSVIDFTGGVAASVIAFVLPPLVEIIINKRNGVFKIENSILCILSIAFGVIMAILTVITSISSFKIGNDCTYIIL